jgi:hypothetical protein
MNAIQPERLVTLSDARARGLFLSTAPDVAHSVIEGAPT